MEYIIIEYPSTMVIGEFVLQVVPKKIEFRTATSLVKLYTLLEFGDLRWKCPHTRFIRLNKCEFYGERLELSNTLNFTASFSVIGINSDQSETVIVKAPIDITSIAERGETVDITHEDEEVLFVFAVKAFEREISEEEYEEILSNRGSDRPLDSEPILTNILNEIQEKMPTLSFSELPLPVSSLHNESKEMELPETPRLREEGDKEQIQEWRLDQSPIARKVETEDEPEITVKVSKSSLRSSSSIISPPGENNQERPLEKSPSGSRVRFTEPILERRETRLSIACTYVLYFIVSLLSFFTGIYAKQNIKH